MNVTHDKHVEFPFRYGQASLTFSYGVRSLIDSVIFDRKLVDAGINPVFFEPQVHSEEIVLENAVEKKTFNVRALDGRHLFKPDVAEPHRMMWENHQQFLYVNEGSAGVARYSIDGTRESVDESKLMPVLRETLKLE